MTDPVRPGWQVDEIRGSEPVWVLDHAEHCVFATPAAAPVADEVRRLLGQGADLDDVAARLEGKSILGPLAIVAFADDTCQVLRIGASATGHRVGEGLVVETLDGDATVLVGDGGTGAGPYVVGVALRRVSAAASTADEPPPVESTLSGSGLDPVADDPTGDRAPSPPHDDSVATGETTALADVVRTTGKRCAVGHFNHPEARFCVQCGRGFDPGVSELLVDAPRPSLGILIDGTGRRFEIDGRLVLGRRPDRSPDARDGATAVPVDAEDASRRHLLVVPDQWDVVAIDVSRNGTYLRRPDGWERLRNGERRVLAPGDRLRVGLTSAPEASWRYLSHHIENAP